jgi:histidyl-tRNA synthetase
MARDKGKIGRPRAEPPKGFRDVFGAEVTARDEMLATIAAVYRQWGFEPLDSPAVETLDALGKYLPDVDRPHAGVFAWQEDAADWLALRYDLTAPLARVYAQHRNDLPNPYRRYAMGPVWRNEKPGPGRFRQFTQCDADTVGTASVAADAEICAMLAEALAALGLGGNHIIRINNRKVLNGVMEVAGLLDPADPEAFAHERGIVLRAIDKLDRLGEQGVQDLLGDGRKDPSGDFTEGASLSNAQIEVVMRFVSANRRLKEELLRYSNIGETSSPTSTLLRLASDAGDRDIQGVVGLSTDVAEYDIWNSRIIESLKDLVSSSRVGSQGVEELLEIGDLLAAHGCGPDRIVIDPSVVRGLGYYTGPVFEAELTFHITGDDGRPRQFGSVAGGGRYDDLVKRFTGQAVPATGISIGVDRLLAALDAHRGGRAPARGPVVVTVMDRDRMADYQRMAAELRAADLRAEVYLGNPRNFGNQLKYADRRGAPAAVIQGSDEAARGVVQIKDLILGARIAESATAEEWRAQPAQQEVPRDNLAAAVQAVLARHSR